MVLLDANSAYCLGLTSKNFLKIIKDPQLRMHKKLFKLVENALMLEDYNKAFKIINSCLILFPWYWKLWRKRSGYWNLQCDYTNVLQDLRKGYEVCTSESFRHIIQSDIYLTANDVKSALSESQKAIDLKPNNMTYYHQRVFVNSRTEMSLQDQAEEYLMILRKGYKRREMVHNNLGYTYFLLEQFDLAAEHFTKAIELNPSYVKPMENKALLHLYRNQLEHTLEYCQQILKLNSRDYDGYRYSAIVHYYFQEYEEAVELIQKSWELSDRMDLRVMKIYFSILDRLGNMNKLVEEVDKVIDYYKAQMTRTTDEISKVDKSDDLMVKAANRKKNVGSGLLRYALKWKVHAHVFLGEFDSAVKLYEESKTFATSDEEDKFFDLLCNQKVVNFNDVIISKQLVTKMARTATILEHEREKFIEQIDAKVNSMDEVTFFSICVLKRTKLLQLLQYNLNTLNSTDEEELKRHWRYASYSCRLVGVEMKDFIRDLLP
jgi:tetratricopeptide (TPR) repeat protein